MFRKDITKEEINELPLRKYEGPIEVVTGEERQQAVLEELAAHAVVGFDTETKPVFKRGVHHDVSLIQLAIPGQAFLIRLNHVGFTDELNDFFADEGIKKVGISIKDDLRHLAQLAEKHHVRFKSANTLDLNDTVKQLDVPHMGVKKLTGIFLGFRVSKGQQTSNWENPRLTEKQQRYAATDAWVCLAIHQRLEELGAEGL
ncbi:MAG: 3'-5' exonuclease [Tunicatimonas sp.]